MAKDILVEVMKHYTDWNADNQIRRSRENGWNDIIDAYNNVLPSNFPYLSHVVAPLIRTTLIEKKARLTNAKLKGRVLGREGMDAIGARIHNALIDFQWDTATEGGTMNGKWGGMDIDSRMFGSKFAYIPWEYEEGADGKVLRNGNGMRPISPEDCGMDGNADNIRNARWFQMREWVTLEDLEYESNSPGLKKYAGLEELKKKVVAGAQNPRDSNYQPRNLQIKGLTDRLGRDKSFPVIEKVTEFRDDEFICFCPKYQIKLDQYKNPYKHRKIPIVQLCYYPLLNDPWGQPEVEAVLPIWRAIQAVINGFLDTMNIHMRPPLKVLENGVRMETLQWGPEATWIVTRMDAIQEHVGSPDALRYFQQTLTALIAEFNKGMGDLSEGVSNLDSFSNNKTATEVKQTAQQQNVRDQDNQNVLADAINDMMSMWISNNQQFLLANPDASEYVLRVVGKDTYDAFVKAGFDQMTVPDETIMALKDIVDMQGGAVQPEHLQALYQAGQVPLHPVLENPSVTNPAKQTYKPKMRIAPDGSAADLSVLPADLEGEYDYIADVKSMSIGATQDLLKSQNNLLTTLTNPQVLLLLQQQGVKPNVKELIESISENSGLSDAEKYFGTVDTSQGPSQNLQQPGLSGTPPTPPQNGQQMGGSANVQNGGGTPSGIFPGMGNGPSVQGAPIQPPTGGGNGF